VVIGAFISREGLMVRRGAQLALIVLLRATVNGCAEDLSALSRQLDQLYRAGKYGEAAEVATRYAAAAKARHGENHSEYATAIAWLGLVYQSQGRYSDAEPLYIRSLAIREEALGPDHPNVGTAVNSLALLYPSTTRPSRS
jgi:tetratricopeptide (TPR) repeat protein